MDFLMFCLNIAWKALAIAGGFLIIKYMLKNGGETIQKLLETARLVLEAAGHAVRKKLRKYLEKELVEEQAKVRVEATIE